MEHAACVGAHPVREHRCGFTALLAFHSPCGSFAVQTGDPAGLSRTGYR
jgi:hypothetical protein